MHGTVTVIILFQVNVIIYVVTELVCIASTTGCVGNHCIIARMSMFSYCTVAYSFGVIAAYCSNCGHCVFETPFGGLRDNVRCSSLTHWRFY